MKGKQKIVVATGNIGKLNEIKSIFSEYEIVSIKDLGIDINIEEDQDTFEKNALKKAIVLSKMIEETCIADDSGIMIKSLDNFPGVRTKRWKTGTDRERNLGILELMKDISKQKRDCDFVTAIALANYKNNISIVKSHTIHGRISTEIRGENGFGFDEIFELENGKTIAELSSEGKNLLSPRKYALEEIRKLLK